VSESFVCAYKPLSISVKARPQNGHCPSKWWRLSLSLARHFEGRLMNVRRSQTTRAEGKQQIEMDAERRPRRRRRPVRSWPGGVTCRHRSRFGSMRHVRAARPSSVLRRRRPPPPLATRRRLLQRRARAPFFAVDCQNWPASKNSTTSLARHLRLPSSMSRSCARTRYRRHSKQWPTSGSHNWRLVATVLSTKLHLCIVSHKNVPLFHYNSGISQWMFTLIVPQGRIQE